MPPRLRFLAMVAAMTALVVPGPTAYAASGPPIGGCPDSQGQNWELVSLEDLNINPEVAAGIASLDRNADGFTCIKRMRNDPAFFVFRDNTITN